MVRGGLGTRCRCIQDAVEAEFAVVVPLLIFLRLHRRVCPSLLDARVRRELR